jgi:hypothetical protein
MMRLSIRHLNSLAEPARLTRLRSMHGKCGTAVLVTYRTAVAPTQYQLTGSFRRLSSIGPCDTLQCFAYTLAPGFDDAPGLSGGSTYTVFL